MTAQGRGQEVEEVASFGATAPDNEVNKLGAFADDDACGETKAIKMNAVLEM